MQKVGGPWVLLNLLIWPPTKTVGQPCSKTSSKHCFGAQSRGALRVSNLKATVLLSGPHANPAFARRLVNQRGSIKQEAILPMEHKPSVGWRGEVGGGAAVRLRRFWGWGLKHE